MSLRLSIVLTCLFSALLILACDEGELDKLLKNVNKCTANETQECHCSDGRKGMQRCAEEGGAWDECACDAVTVPDCSPQPEICDKVDNDCDGLTDENAVDIITWYQDKDGDGFGTELFVKSCESYASFLATKTGDCDDSNPLVNPMETEVCDGVDNNCDGMADEGFQLKWYRDEDGDGFGTSDFIAGCQAEASTHFTAAKGKDCDDTDAEVHPGANETECDGIDNNCDGQTDPKTHFDSASGICWQKSPLATTMTRAAALSYCEGLELGEASDWSLPDIDELRLLIRNCPANEMGGFCPVTTVADPTVDSTLCSSCSAAGGPAPGGCYWPTALPGGCDDVYISSTTAITDQKEETWYINFIDADIKKAENARGLARCVRYPAMPTGQNILPSSTDLRNWTGTPQIQGPEGDLRFEYSTATELSPEGTSGVFRMDTHTGQATPGYVYMITPGNVYSKFEIGDHYTFSIWLRSKNGDSYPATLTMVESREEKNLGLPNEQSIQVTGTWQRFRQTVTLTGWHGTHPPESLVPSLKSEGVSSFFIWGPQLEKGAAATEYRATRRVNLLPNSRDLTKWSGSTVQSISTAVDPQGNAGAFEVQDPGPDWMEIQQLVYSRELEMRVGDVYTFSIWLKRDGMTNEDFLLQVCERPEAPSADFTTNCGAALASSCPISDTAWTRCSATVTLREIDSLTNPGYLKAKLVPVLDKNQGDDKGNLLAYGPQLERGPVATTYRPTGNFPNLFVDGNMEETQETTWRALWHTSDGAQIAKTAENPREGNYALRLETETGSGTLIRKNLLQVGTTYRMVGFAKGNGSTCRPVVGDWGINLWEGTIADNWQPMNVELQATYSDLHFKNICDNGGYADYDNIRVFRLETTATLARQFREAMLRATP